MEDEPNLPGIVSWNNRDAAVVILPVQVRHQKSDGASDARADQNIRRKMLPGVVSQISDV